MRKRIRLVPVSMNRKKREQRPAIDPEAYEWVREAFQPELLRCAERYGSHGEAWYERHKKPR